MLVKLFIATIILGISSPGFGLISIQTGLLVCIASVLGALFLFVFSLLTKTPFQVNSVAPNTQVFVIMGLTLGMSWVTYMESLRYCQDHVSMIFYCTYPMALMVMSSLVFAERLNNEKVIAIGLAFIGTLFLLGFNGKSSMKQGEVPGAIMALIGMLLLTMNITVNKAVNDKVGTVDPLHKTIIQLLTSAIVSGLYAVYQIVTEKAVFTGEPNLLRVVVGIIVAALCISFGMYLLYSSINELHMQKIAAELYMTPLIAGVLTLLAEEKIPDTYTMIGMIMVIAGIVLNHLKGNHITILKRTNPGM